MTAWYAGHDRHQSWPAYQAVTSTEWHTPDDVLIQFHSPDDEHWVSRNMGRREINKYIEKSASSWLLTWIIAPDFRFSQRCCWRFKSLCLSHGIDRWRVTDISNEHIVFIFRVQSKKSGLLVTEYEDNTVLRSAGNCLPIDESWHQLKCCTH